jgi:hypothetical protein
VPPPLCSILQTMRHFIGGDSLYLSHLTDARQIATEHMDLRELRATMQADESAWIELLAKDLDPGAIVRDVDE